MSLSLTERNAVPSSGNGVPAPICALAKAIPKSGADAHHLAGAAHLRAEHRVLAGELGEREDRFLDEVAGGPPARSVRPELLAALRPTITLAAMPASGTPVALATKGTVRLARGLTSST